MTREEIAARYPDAARFTLELRELFGADARLTWARNPQGEEIGRRLAGLSVLARLLVTIRLFNERSAFSTNDAWVSRIRYDRRSSPGAPAP